MNDKINNLIKKFLNKETISYLIFGVLTTIINIVVFWFAERELAFIMSEDAASLVGNVIAWVISVAFAFVTNKLFVFESKFLLSTTFSIDSGIITFLSEPHANVSESLETLSYATA